MPAWRPRFSRGEACPQPADRRVEEDLRPAFDRNGDKNAAEPVLNMKFTLLTHSKEFEKRSNTGRLVLDVLGNDAEQIRWDRMEPPAGLLKEIESGGVALVYPGAADESGDDLTGITHFILIDGTWHEARKIHQRSPYLQKVRRVGLTPSGTSRYNLRKNQKEACLCTAECVIEILRSTGDAVAADRLEEGFLAFIRQSGAKPAMAKEVCTET
jgi:DTW domain-containing protein